MKILLFVTQEYQNLLPPFFYLFRKYFGDNKVILVVDKPLTVQLDANTESFVVPGYEKEAWNFKINFGDGMLKAMNHYEETHYIVLFPDHWLHNYTDIEGLRNLIEYCKTNEDVVRANIAADNCIQGYGFYLDTYKNLEILRGNLSQNTCVFESAISFCPSIFTTHHCNKLLSTGWSLWECESLGTEALKNYDGYTITAKENILFHEHVCSQHRKGNAILNKNKFKVSDMDNIIAKTKQWTISYL